MSYGNCMSYNISMSNSNYKFQVYMFVIHSYTLYVLNKY